MNFIDKLRRLWKSNESLVCVGLDPDLSKFPQALARNNNAIFRFNRAIIDATHDLVCAYKPQIAHFAAYAAEKALQKTIDYIKHTYPQVPVILDAKRGDIGSTAEKYACEAFDRYGADALTVNPYLGYDAVAPFLRRKDRGVVLLCRTSNKGAEDIQDLDVGGQPLYEKIAELVAKQWNDNGNCMLVVGATWPDQLARIRTICGDMPLLVPGVGAQGGDVEALVTAGRTGKGTGLVVSSSRGILYASDGADYAQAARTETDRLRQLINRFR